MTKVITPVLYLKYGTSFSLLLFSLLYHPGNLEYCSLQQLLLAICTTLEANECFLMVLASHVEFIWFYYRIRLLSERCSVLGIIVLLFVETWFSSFRINARNFALLLISKKTNEQTDYWEKHLGKLYTLYEFWYNYCAFIT